MDRTFAVCAVSPPESRSPCGVLVWPARTDSRVRGFTDVVPARFTITACLRAGRLLTVVVIETYPR